MKDRQRLFLDKVTKILVEDTIIDYDRKEIYFPFFPPSYSFTSPPPSSLPLSSLPSLSSYCKYNYGLTEEETDYVWKIYKDIIIGKLNNNER